MSTEKIYRVRLDLNKSAELGRPIYTLWRDGVVEELREEVWLRDVVFVIDPVKQRITQTTGEKNIHAWLEGRIGRERPCEGRLSFSYNPMKDMFFHAGGRRLAGATTVHIKGRELWLWDPVWAG